jgi:hypothetical protein
VRTQYLLTASPYCAPARRRRNWASTAPMG